MKDLFFLFLFCASLFGAAPSALYLTWIHDPTTTMTIQWLTPLDEPNAKVYYREKGKPSWEEAYGGIVDVSEQLLVHTTELTQLSPYTDYEFRVAEESEIYQFRTLPSTLDQQIKFAVGGDAYSHKHIFQKMNAQIAKTSPDFVIVGGDIAYTVNRFHVFKGKYRNIKRWKEFFTEWKKMVTPEGRMIPLLPAIGNHDIKTKNSKRQKEDWLIYTFFAFPETEVPFRAFDIGKELSLFFLDSGHHYKIPGAQQEWLETALKQRENTPYKMAVYHIAAYPSYYKFHDKDSTQIRTYWSPLFEKYGVEAVFENDNHTFKRTHKIKEGKIDETGILYLGDGSWGVSPRTPYAAWYLAKTASKNTFWLTTLSSEKAVFQAFDIKGQLLDEVETAKPKGR